MSNNYKRIFLFLLLTLLLVVLYGCEQLAQLSGKYYTAISEDSYVTLMFKADKWTMKVGVGQSVGGTYEYDSEQESYKLYTTDNQSTALYLYPKDGGKLISSDGVTFYKKLGEVKESDMYSIVSDWYNNTMENWFKDDNGGFSVTQQQNSTSGIKDPCGKGLFGDIDG